MTPTRPLLIAACLLLASAALAGCADGGGTTTHLEVRFNGNKPDFTSDVKVDLNERPLAAQYERDGIPHPDAFTAHDQLDAWSRSAGKTYATTSFPDSGFGAGYFLTGIDGISGDGTNAYWSLAINGQESLKGMSEAVVAAGDTVTWTYTEPGLETQSAAGLTASSSSTSPARPAQGPPAATEDEVTIALEPLQPTPGEKVTLRGTVAPATSLTVIAYRSDVIAFTETLAADGPWSLDVPLEFGHSGIEVFGVDGGFANLTAIRLAPITFEVLYTAAVPPQANSEDTVWLDIDAFASGPGYSDKPRPHPDFANVHDAMVTWETQTGNIVEYSYSQSFDFGVDRINGAGNALSAGEPPYWGYKVNGGTADFGITLQPVAPGDTVTWELAAGV